MRQLIAKLDVSDSMGNKKVLKVFTDRDEGTVGYSLVGTNSGTSFAVSNMQCGWRGPSLPDNTYEYKTNNELLSAVTEAVRGGVYKVDSKKLFVE